ncbi:lipocalin family protein [Profundibacter sp.]
MLLGCTPVGGAGPSYRDVARPITSIALFDPAQFSGHWEVVASFGSITCAFDVVTVNADMFDLAERACLGAVTHSVALITGPGRYTPKGGANKAHEHWVMWVDQTYRTAVIGAMAGEFGMILNRDQDIPADRLAAAREILDWNGYDLSRLQMRPKGE